MKLSIVEEERPRDRVGEGERVLPGKQQVGRRERP